MHTPNGGTEELKWTTKKLTQHKTRLTTKLKLLLKYCTCWYSFIKGCLAWVNILGCWSTSLKPSISATAMPFRFKQVVISSLRCSILLSTRSPVLSSTASIAGWLSWYSSLVLSANKAKDLVISSTKFLGSSLASFSSEMSSPSLQISAALSSNLSNWTTFLALCFRH